MLSDEPTAAPPYRGARHVHLLTYERRADEVPLVRQERDSPLRDIQNCVVTLMPIVRGCRMATRAPNWAKNSDN